MIGQRFRDALSRNRTPHLLAGGIGGAAADYFAVGEAQVIELAALDHREKPKIMMGMTIDVRALTPDLWPYLRDLFGKKGACGGCWCMYWRIGSTYREQPSRTNRAAFQRIVKKGPPPGLLAFKGDLAVGWCQLTPRDALPWLNRTWRLRAVDGEPVWSISCFYIRKGYRKQGITSALIAAAVKAAKKAGAPGLEAYPLDADLTPSASGTGYLSTFLRAGFKVVARRTPPRPIVRLDFASQ